MSTFFSLSSVGLERLDELALVTYEELIHPG